MDTAGTTGVSQHAGAAAYPSQGYVMHDLVLRTSPWINHYCPPYGYNYCPCCGRPNGFYYYAPYPQQPWVTTYGTNIPPVVTQTAP